MMKIEYYEKVLVNKSFVKIVRHNGGLDYLLNSILQKTHMFISNKMWFKKQEPIELLSIKWQIHCLFLRKSLFVVCENMVEKRVFMSIVQTL